MNLTALIALVIKSSVMLNVLALGFTTTFEDCTDLLKRPGLLLRTLLSLFAVMLVFAVAVVSMFALPPPAKVAIVALALSPVPPLLPKKLRKVGGSLTYGVSLLVIASLAAIVIIPVSVELLGCYFSSGFRVPAVEIVPITLTMLIIPLALGIVLRRIAPRFVERITAPTQLTATILLALSVLPLLLIASRAMWAMIGTGALASLALFSLVGLAVGHLLGGPDPDDRTVLALATSTRHPGIATTIAALTFPDLREVLFVVLVHLVIAGIVATPYSIWRKRYSAARAAS